MKQKLELLATFLVISMFSAGDLLPESVINCCENKTILLSPIPDDLNKIFKNSCMGCHAEGGKTLAMFHLNFSDWENYKPEKQAAKAADICKQISKGAMPPKAARKMKPDGIPTATQLESICNWSKSLNMNK